jgi:sec-independent protein translocase protein TatB
MFDLFDPSKIFLVGVVALIVIGPKELPRVMRTVGQVVGRMRRMANDFQQQFNEAMREAELEDVKKELAAMNDAAKVEVDGLDVSFNPATLTQHDNTKALEEPKPAEEKPAQEHPAQEKPAEENAAEAMTNGVATSNGAVTPRAEPIMMTPPGDPPSLQAELSEIVGREGRAP